MKLSLKIKLPVFIIVGLAQWLVPAQMIAKREKVLQKGSTFRFLTEPVDPTNPFIGKYITLNFQDEVALVPQSHSFEKDQTVYVLLQNDSAGFAHISGVTAEEPTSKTDYVKAKVKFLSNYSDNDSVEMNIDYPFDEYYMEEHKAPKAEEEYRKANQDSTKFTYAQVKIWKGMAVTEDIFINNEPLNSFFK